MAKKQKRMCPCPKTPGQKAYSIYRLARTCEEKQAAVAFVARSLASQRDALPASKQPAFDKKARAETDKIYKSVRRSCGAVPNERFAKARAGLFGY